MPRDTTRRGLLAALLGGGVAGAAASPASGFLDRFAPLSGAAWPRRRRLPATVDSPHGDATVTYDDYGVPHVEAEAEAAAYYAVGYVQASDRLFEMDLIRRRMDGTLAAAVGEPGVENDVFAAKMDFRGGAEASREAVAGSEAARLGAAYVGGVNAYIADRPLPLEFDLAGYEPREWSLVDTLLVGQQVSWGLTGSFATLRRAVLRRELGAETYERLYGRPFEHGAPIVREGRTGGEVVGVGDGDESDAGVVADAGDGAADADDGAAGTDDGATGTDDGAAGAGDGTAAGEGSDRDALRDLDPGFAGWLVRFEPPPLLGSNHWAVSGEHTASGRPILAYDPHLTLMAPPVWYEQRVSAGGVDVRGATFPGIPFVIVGENGHGAWGFTNTGADVVDLYTYEVSDDGTRYRYRGEWREFDAETRTIEVSGGRDREVEVRKTVHGPFLDREVGGDRRHVGVAWTGFSGTRETQSIYRFAHAEGRDDYLDALRTFDVPTQNALYVDDEGILYKVTGQIPVRRIDGEVVRGDRVFDGSAGEGEWAGFEPFGQSTWEGFVPFEDKPGVRDPGYLGTANQRPVDDPTYPVGQAYASGFRGLRIYERLDERVASDEPVDPAFMRDLQRDALDVRARLLVPAILDARDRTPDAADPWLDAMEAWDYRMEPDSRAALAFHHVYEAFREATWADDFAALGLEGSAWWPQEWTLATLPGDDEFFGGDRAAVLAEAVERAIERIDGAGWETYGDFKVTAVDHPFGGQVPALNYPRYPTGGSGFTVFNHHGTGAAGSSWRQVSPMDGDSVSVVPGGNDGSYFSEHYDDQLRMWADGEYKPMAFATPADGRTVDFRGGDG